MSTAGGSDKYRDATEADVHFFREHGWLVVEDVIDPADLVALEARCDEIIANRDRIAFDWAWEKNQSRDTREFKILQGSPSHHSHEFDHAPFRTWAVSFGSALLGLDVDVRNGCMHFIDGGHLDGVIEHRRPEHIQSDLLACAPDESRTIACPISLGSVTFHHGKTPHMTTANVTDEWRRILTQHLRAVGVTGEGDHYPWKVYVNQFTGELTTPDTR